jgi:predicted DNA-binding protein (MmcQ/YjbR family)
MENKQRFFSPIDDPLLENKKPIEEKLLSDGFKKEGEAFILESPLAAGQFSLEFKVYPDGRVERSICDSLTGDEYSILGINGSRGNFAEKLSEEADKLLNQIVSSCFEDDILKSEQGERVKQFLKEKYDVEPEYLWEDDDEDAAIRENKTKKWFGVLIIVSRKKLLQDREGKVQVLTLKAEKDKASELIDGKAIYPAYHMNKKSWITVPLDGSLEDEKLFALIDKSYALLMDSLKKKKTSKKISVERN